MRTADRAFGGLVLLALGSSALLVALLAALLPRATGLASGATADVASIVALLVLVLATLGIALGLTSLFRQLLATLGLIRSLLTRKIATPRRVAAIAASIGLADRLDIVQDLRPFSFCYWFRSPRICLSTGLIRRLSDAELLAVLVEELVEYYTVQKEMAADQAAVRAMGGVRELASALFKVLPDAEEVELGLLVPVGSLSVTEARIDQLVDGRPVPLVLTAASVWLSGGALAAAAVLAFTDGLHPAPLTVPGLIGPASLLFAAAVVGAAHQVRLVVLRPAR